MRLAPVKGKKRNNSCRCALQYRRTRVTSACRHSLTEETPCPVDQLIVLLMAGVGCIRRRRRYPYSLRECRPFLDPEYLHRASVQLDASPGRPFEGADMRYRSDTDAEQTTSNADEQPYRQERLSEQLNIVNHP
jgi:hypothetical protein